MILKPKKNSISYYFKVLNALDKVVAHSKSCSLTVALPKEIKDGAVAFLCILSYIAGVLGKFVYSLDIILPTQQRRQYAHHYNIVGGIGESTVEFGIQLHKIFIAAFDHPEHLLIQLLAMP